MGDILIKGIILSAGIGKRLDKYTPKPLVKLLGKTLISYAYDNLKRIGIDDITIISSPHLKLDFDCKIIIQNKLLGTGDALKLVKDKGTFIVIPVDTPLVSSETLKSLIQYHYNHKNDITILAAKIENPYGYGRIFRHPLRIIEENDLRIFQKNNKLINTGIYILNDKVINFTNKIKMNKKKGEYYLTDIFKYLPLKIKKGIYITKNADEVRGINTPSNLIEVSNILKKRINDIHRKNQVMINEALVGPDVIIEAGAKISDDSVIFGKSYIKGNTKIVKSIIENSIINNSTIGPFAHIINSQIDCATIGNFVEVKNSQIDSNTKAKHLSYIGDTHIFNNVNIGAGVIFSNYDGFKKNRSEVGSYSFIGSNSTIISPVNIGMNCYIGAGSEVTKTINDNMFYLRRASEKIYVNKKTIENKN